MSLLEATSKNNVKDVVQLLMAGADVNEVDDDDNTPLNIATINGNLLLVQTFLNYDADVNHQNAASRTPLINAILNNHTNIGKLLIESGANINLFDLGGRTPLLAAVETSNLEIVNALIGEGVDVNIPDVNMRTPLMTAANVDDLDIARVLLDNGANIEAVDSDGETALFWIFQDQDVNYILIHNMAELLIEYGANVNATSAEGISTLMRAASLDAVDTMKLLISKNAHYNEGDNSNETPLFYAAAGQAAAACRYLLSLPDVSVDHTNNTEQTCLMLTSSRNYTNIMSILIEFGASVFAQDNDGWTPLIYACNAGNADATTLLLDTDIRCLEIISNSGQTPLHYAVADNSVECVNILLEYGADPLSENNDGSTPLEVTTDETDPQIVDILLTAEAEALHNASTTLSLKLGAVRTAVRKGTAPKAPRLMQRVVQQSEYDRLCNVSYLNRMRKAEIQALARSYSIPIANKTKVILCQDIALKLKQIR